MTQSLLFPAAAMLVFMSAAIYGFGFLHAEISLWRSFWKTLPVALMAATVALFDLPVLLVQALVLSAIGDYFLSLGKSKFTLGLVSFLTAHLLYIWLFWQLTEGVKLGWGHAGMAAFALIYGTYLWSRTGTFRLPVMAYTLVIALMVSVALMLPTAYMLVVLGSLAFAFSDSVLALEMFVVSNPKSRNALSKVVWVSYIIAQSLIVVGLVERM